MSIRCETGRVPVRRLPGAVAIRGFTLGELLIVLAIIAVLIALLLPATRSSRGAARRFQCAQNLKQIAIALFNYEAAYGGLPPACTVDANGRPLHSWRTLILPYLEQDELYRTIDLTKPWDDPANAEARETALNVFRCFESTGPKNTTTYLATLAPLGLLSQNETRRRKDVKDDPRSTLMVIEAGEVDAVPWMAPKDADEALVLGLGPGSKLHHGGGSNVVFVDRHSSFLPADVSPRERRALMSIAGDDEVDVHW